MVSKRKSFDKRNHFCTIHKDKCSSPAKNSNIDARHDGHDARTLHCVELFWLLQLLEKNIYFCGFSVKKTKSISKIPFQLLPFTKLEMTLIQFSICHYDYIWITNISLQRKKCHPLGWSGLVFIYFILSTVYHNQWAY